MATFEINRSAPFGSNAASRVAGAWQSAVDSLTAWNEARKTRRVLRKLSDDVLEDIGLTRADVYRM